MLKAYICIRYLSFNDSLKITLVALPQYVISNQKQNHSIYLLWFFLLITLPKPVTNYIYLNH